MFENIGSFIKKIMKNDTKELVSDTTLSNASKEAAKERLQLVLMQDRANVSADFLELMKQEIVDVIKKYIVVEEDTIDVRIINQENEDGTNGAPSLCANIPILNIRNDNKSEKFRNEQNANITKDITNEEVIKESSNDSSNDNVEIENNLNVEEENSDITIKDNIEEIIEEKAEIAEKEIQSEVEEINQLSEESEDNILEDDIMIKDLENYDDEDDEDVTFDDLLKAAEEEERMKSPLPKTIKKTTAKSKSSTSKKGTTKSKSTSKSKTTSKSSNKGKTNKK